MTTDAQIAQDGFVTGIHRETLLAIQAQESCALARSTPLLRDARLPGSLALHAEFDADPGSTLLLGLMYDGPEVVRRLGARQDPRWVLESPGTVTRQGPVAHNVTETGGKAQIVIVWPHAVTQSAENVAP